MIEIIPAIDIIDGKCVRLSQGDYDQKKVYNEDPLEVAKMFEDHGIRRLHLVDLDGAKSHHIVNYQVLEKIASRTSLIIDFGGGLKSDFDLTIAFDNGANMVTIGSLVVKSPDVFESWLNKFRATKIILGADCKDRKISVAGWKESTDLDVIPFIHQWRRKGVEKVICTDIAKDGMLEGPSFDLYNEILEQDSEVYLIASGGISSIEDIENLRKNRVPAVIIGKAIYEGKIKMNQLLPYL